MSMTLAFVSGQSGAPEQDSHPISSPVDPAGMCPTLLYTTCTRMLVYTL